MERSSACHGTDNFVPGPNIFNNGLEFPYVDAGKGAITGVAADNGKFKVGSLRNIELTAPYMHDGRFATLEQVVDFYNRGGDFNEVGHHEEVRELGLTQQEKSDLVAFMKSLTDERVRYKRAPFDHPQLFITNGPANVATGSDNPADQLIEIPAVGAAGGTPTRNFLD